MAASIIFDQRHCWVLTAQGGLWWQWSYVPRLKYNTLRFSQCLHGNRDHNLVVVTYALEKDLLEEADVASYTKIFFKLFVQRQMLIRSFPLSRHISSWHVNKTTTTDFETCRKQCTQWLKNACSRLSAEITAHVDVSQKPVLWTTKCRYMHTSAKFPLGQVV